MDEKTREDYAYYRLEKAKTCLSAARLMVNVGDYDSAANRSYYAIFHSIRSILALDEVDFKRHSAVISYFRKEYIKTHIFDEELSDILGRAFEARGGSDYDDFYAISKERVEDQIANAETFYQTIDKYLMERINKTDHKPNG